MTMTASHVALLILLLAVLACLLARLLGRWLRVPLARLTEVTTDSSDTLLYHQAIPGPYSLVTDLEALTATLRSMVDGMQHNVHAIQRTNETLELRVQERTQQLLEAKTKLGKEILQRAQTEELLAERTERLEAIQVVTGHDLEGYEPNFGCPKKFML